MIFFYYSNVWLGKGYTSGRRNYACLENPDEITNITKEQLLCYLSCYSFMSVISQGKG
jgi:hypothetical protein